MKGCRPGGVEGNGDRDRHHPRGNARAKGFYCGLLALEKLPRPDFGSPGLWLRVGDLQLHLITLDSVENRSPAHFAFHVLTGAFHETMAAIETTMVRSSSRVDFDTIVWAAQITDPFGNQIEITDVGPLPA